MKPSNITIIATFRPPDSIDLSAATATSSKLDIGEKIVRDAVFSAFAIVWESIDETRAEECRRAVVLREINSSVAHAGVSLSYGGGIGN
jgi:hypothetical protein